MINKNWIIIDTLTCKAIYGTGQKIMKFTTEEIAIEVAAQLFKDDRYIIFNTSQLNR